MWSYFFSQSSVGFKKAFSIKNDDVHDFESWYISKDEYIALLEELYSKNYVLTNMKDLLNGRVVLDKNKIPLIMSFDDMNYYDFMQGYGVCEKLNLNKQEETVTILEKFIQNNPDFSYNNARGIIALTGYEGALGYRNTNDPELHTLIKNLKNMGYDFACHSWGHHHRIYSDENPHGKKGIIDMQKWLEGVGKAVGKTDIFITPFGVDIRNNPMLHTYLKKKGFKYFCSVGRTRMVEKCNNVFYLDRFNIDGITLTGGNYYYKALYAEPKKLYSKYRKTPYPHLGRNSETLVKYAKFCLSIPTMYFKGGIGQVLSNEFISQIQLDSANMWPKKKVNKLNKLIDNETRLFDDRGLIVRFILGGFTDYKYDNELDLSTLQLYERSPNKGTIDTMPNVEGICLYTNNHVGIYIGKDEVIEAKNQNTFNKKNCVVKIKLNKSDWTNWFLCPYVDYPSLK